MLLEELLIFFFNFGRKVLIDSGLQISLKIKLRSEAKAKFFSRKIAKRSEAKLFSVCAKRSEANNLSKLRKNAKLRNFFLSLKKSLSSLSELHSLILITFTNLIFLMSNLYIDFLATYLKTRKSWMRPGLLKKIFRKNVYFSRNPRQTHQIVKGLPKFVRKPEITAANPNSPE